MKIQQPSENSLYVTIGNYVYYFDDSINGEAIVKRWRVDNDIDEVRNLFSGVPLFADEETLQNSELCQ
jgi:hypothetical protein